jgi:hypothetical protein
MTKITVKSNGNIRIKLLEEQAPAGSASAGANAPSIPENTSKLILLKKRLIKDIELRTESNWRVNEDDKEQIYAISGSDINTPDSIHTLASDTVVEEMTQDHIRSSITGISSYITKDRDTSPKLIVIIHTHPEGDNKPSSKDKTFFKYSAQIMKEKIPEVKVLFGVHAISSMSLNERQDPQIISNHILYWRSVNREHFVGFYTSEAIPCEVKICD